MTPITKWAGPLCLIAAALVISSELLRLAIGLTSGPDMATTVAHTLSYGLALVAMFALLLALTALYLRGQRALGTLGLVAYLTAALGIVLVAGDWWFEAFAVPTIGAAAPQVLALPPGGSLLVGAMITAGLFAAGWIMFGVAAIRGGAFSTPACVLLMVGGVCGVFALSTPYQLPLAVAVGWIGYTLIRSRHQAPVGHTGGPVPTIVGGLPSNGAMSRSSRVPDAR
jgi:hypothetical protein